MSKYPDKYISLAEEESLAAVKSISLLGAVAGGITLVLFFLIIALMGYYYHLWLHFINLILLVPLITISLKKYIVNVNDKSWLEAYGVSFLTIAGSYLFLAFFMIIYLSLIDRSYLYFLQEHIPTPLTITLPGIAAGLLAEGIIAGILLSMILLRFFRKKI